MSPRRSSRCSSKLSTAPKKSPQRSPSPDEGVIQRKLRSKRWRNRSRKTDGGNSVFNADNGSSGGIAVDAQDAPVAEEDEYGFIKITDKGVDDSDEDSVTSSIASGPSVLYNTMSRKQRPPQCSACQKLYQRAKKMKAPIKSKLLDTDPKSSTCDQWVLIKKRRPRRLLNVTGKLLIHVHQLKKGVKLKKDVKPSEQQLKEGESSICSRPHTFLQRNLRYCIKVAVKKEPKSKRRKRTRDESQGSRSPKQQRLNSSNPHPHITNRLTSENDFPPTSNHHISSPGAEISSNEETSNQVDTDLKVKLIPCSVVLENISPIKRIPLRQPTPKKTSGFRNLLVQLRGNSGMIFRETR
ncbi:uncharacterized protein LOC115058068 [Echeneis naucrates]|uniref:uncharacterized protein LOC115058068 n=1 Tax=Echeneis naucrates TaxID=173247 RepID=UPI00111455B9|nr:uncharacterized protein LOC115058068 [Echeneis naucrates]